MKKILILVLVMLLLVSTVNATLKAGYHFDNTVEDYVGIYDTYSSNSLIFDTGKSGNALNYIDATNVLKIITDSNFPTRIGETGTVTMNFWYYKTGNPSDTASFIGGTENINNQLRLGFEQLNNGSIWFYADRSGTGSNLLLTPTLNNNTWYMITGIYNNKNMKLYINGLLNNSGTYTQTGAVTNTANLSFGRSEGDRLYTHRIDEFLLYNNELTPSEVLNLYEGTSDNFTITSYDNYNLSNVYNFNATIDGILYNSNITSGQLISPILANSTSLHNISIFAHNYLTETYTNYNVSTNIYQIMNYYKSRHNITAFIQPLNVTPILYFNVSTSGGYTGRTTTGSLIVPTEWNSTETIFIYPDNYQYSNVSTNGTGNWNYTFFLYGKNSLNIHFYDELTRNLITNLVSLEIISNIYSTNKTTTNGSIYVDLLQPTDYILRYYSNNTDYSQRLYSLSVTDGSYSELSLYLLNESDPHYKEVTANVLSILNEKLIDATIYVQKYNVASNSYQNVEVVNTNFEGKAILHLTDNEFYKFIIIYKGNIVLSTSPTYINEATMTFYCNLAQDPTQSFYDIYGIKFNVSYSNISQIFTYTYLDSNNVLSNTCLELYKLDSIHGDTLVNSSCLTSHSGSISLGTVYVNGSSYEAKVYATIDGVKIHLKSLIINFGKELANTGKLGLYLILLMTIIFAMVGIFNPLVMLILAPLPLLFGAVTGLVDVSISIVAGVILAVLILIVYLGREA